MVIKTFPNIRKFAWKSTKEQQWNTEVKRSGSGKVRTMTTWHYPQYIITAEYTYLTPKEMKELMGFFATIKGGHEAFWWLDPEDNKEENIFLGHGSNNQWQAVRKYGDYVEPVYKIDNLTLYADGKELTKVSHSNGLIRTKNIISPTAVITATYNYYWKVRLADKGFSTQVVYRDFFKSKTMKLETVK